MAAAETHGEMNVGTAERVASALGGTALVLNALIRPSVGRGLLALGGLALIERGVTGSCAVYRALGLDTSDTPKIPERTYGTGKRGDPRLHKNAVDIAVDESFPASDPPAWTSSAVGRPDPVG